MKWEQLPISQARSMWIMNIVMNFERPFCPLHFHVIPRMQSFFSGLAQIQLFVIFFLSHTKGVLCVLLNALSLAQSVCSRQSFHCFVNGWRTHRAQKKGGQLTIDTFLPCEKNPFTFLWCCVLYIVFINSFKASCWMSNFEGSLSFWHRRSECVSAAIDTSISTEEKTVERKNGIFDERIVNLTHD